MPVTSCSGRFIAPFLKVLTDVPALASEVARSSTRFPDQRVGAEDAYRSIARWVEISGDEDLGLRAAESACLGSGGALDFAFYTADTLRDAILLAERHSNLLNDAIEVVLNVEGDRASIRFSASPQPPRAAMDLVLGLWYRLYLRPHLDPSARAECSFSARRPASLEVHERAFAGAAVRFGAPHDALSFDVRALEAGLASANRPLHTVHRQHLEVLQASLASSPAVAPRVRGLIAAELQHGHPSSSFVARKLSMSRRTLVRRLHEENTSFRMQLDAVRRGLALRMISMRTLPLTEVSSLLGFSCVQAFHRAFKRWTGQSPLQYRESILGGAGQFEPAGMNGSAARYAMRGGTGDKTYS